MGDEHLNLAWYLLSIVKMGQCHCFTIVLLPPAWFGALNISTVLCNKFKNTINLPLTLVDGMVPVPLYAWSAYGFRGLEFKLLVTY